MRKRLLLVCGAALFIVGLGLLSTAPSNTPFEGWSMLARALGGQALIVCAVDIFARLSSRRVRARRIALLVTSMILLPLSALVLLMTKESGPSWQTAALLLVVWYFGSAVYSATRLARSRC